MARPTASRSVTTVTTGEAGSGKSYVRCARFLTDVFLPEKTGVHYSNFPVGVVPENHSTPPTFEGETFADRIAAKVAKRTGQEAEDIKARIQVIDPEALAAWEKGTSGPWDYFSEDSGRSLLDAHVAIDEVHNFFGPNAGKDAKKRWMQWIGEIRHQGATVEFISQSRGKIPMEIRQEAGFWLHLKNTETERDPIFKIELGDWYELWAGLFFREYRAKFVEEERRSITGATTKAEIRRLYPIEPEYFELYDSFSAPQKGGVKGQARKRVFQTKSRVGILLWFVKRNLTLIIPKLLLALIVYWLLMGGFGRVFDWLMSKSKGMMGGMTGTSTAAPKENRDIEHRDGVKQIQIPLEIQEEIDAQKAELDKLRNQLKTAEHISGIGLTTITLKDGRTYKYGDTIDLGPLQGKRITKIDYAKRLCYLHDGTVLNLPVVRKRETSGGLFK